MTTTITGAIMFIALAILGTILTGVAVDFWVQRKRGNVIFFEQ